MPLGSILNTMATPAPTNILNDPAAWAADVTTRIYDSVQTFLPDLLLASIQLLLGLVAAWLIRLIILRFGRGLDRLLSTFRMGTTIPVAHTDWPISTIFGNIAFWIIIAFSLVTASKSLDLIFLANWLQELLSYLPRLLISAAILFIGNLISQGLRDLIQGYAFARDDQHGSLFAQLVAGLVLVFALLLALDQLGLDVSLLENIIILAFAALFGGTALAFGMGAADSIRNIMASHYIRNQYQPGLQVQVGELKGEILELTTVAVLLDNENGQIMIPARIFMEKASLILEPEEVDGT